MCDWQRSRVDLIRSDPSPEHGCCALPCRSKRGRRFLAHYDNVSYMHCCCCFLSLSLLVGRAGGWMDGWMEYPTGSLLCVHGVISLPCSSSFSLICISRDWRLHRLVPPSFPSFLPSLLVPLSSSRPRSVFFFSFFSR